MKSILKNNIRIAFFNTYLKGGAANAAIRLFSELLKIKSIKADLFYRFPESPFQNTTSFKNAEPLNNRNFFDKIKNSVRGRFYYSRIINRLKNRPENLEVFSFPVKYYKTPLSGFGFSPDILHLHWIEEWIDYPSFFSSIPDNLPIIWTLHDMNPFTGGCHFSLGCRNYLKDCNNCPQLSETNKHEAKKNLLLKKKLFQDKNIYIVTPSKWLGDCAGESYLFNKFPVHVIPYGLDTDIFIPLDKDTVRVKHKLPTDDFLILFVAGNMDNPRKGWIYLKKALELISSKYKVTVVSVGSLSNDDELSGINHFNIGIIEETSELNEIYSACDVIVIPSLEDNLPNTILEAISSGTPAIGFNTGGIPDIIIHEYNGLLAISEDPEDLTKKIEILLADPLLLKAMSINARESAIKKFDNKVQLKNYLELYERVLKYNMPV
jgi:glycosyltransferase involved in cell wall biosynthesis